MTTARSYDNRSYDDRCYDDRLPASEWLWHAAGFQSRKRWESL